MLHQQINETELFSILVFYNLKALVWFFENSIRKINEYEGNPKFSELVVASVWGTGFI